MLKEDQAAELLHRSEVLVGRTLAGIRSQLTIPERRALALWEFLCIDSISQLGPIAYEPPHGESSPDIILSDVGSSEICVEAAFIYPRHWKNARRERELSERVYKAVESNNVAATRISLHFFGPATAAGYVRHLPEQQQLRRLISSEPMAAFFTRLREFPSEVHEATFPPYTFRIKYDPNENGPFIPGSGVVEAPSTVDEHAVFRTLRHKRAQHRPTIPYVVCIGSDQSFAVGRHFSPLGIDERAAVIAALAKSRRISAVITIAIESALAHGLQRIASGSVYRNDNAERPLDQIQIAALKGLDFNRWAYYFPLQQWESDNMKNFERSGGTLYEAHSDDSTTLSLPTTVLVDCLAGKTALKAEYSSMDHATLLARIEEGWQVVACSFEPGKIEQGLGNRITLKLARPPEKVYSKPALAG